MKDYSKLYDIIEFPEISRHISDTILPMFDEYPDMEEKTREYVNGESIHKYLEKICQERSLRLDHLFMAFCIYCTDYTHELYVKKNLDDKVFYDTMKEIMIWNRDCVKNYHCNGINNYNWLGHILRAHIIRLGRLEFTEEPFPLDKVELNGREFVKGQMVVTTHVPEDGPLSPELFRESFEMAYKYFNTDVLFCESWLLYPKHYEFLPESFNIVKFMKEFQLFHEGEYVGAGELWRIFGYRDNYKSPEVPQNTSLQRLYYKWYCEHGVVGYGYGVRFK